MIRSSIFALRLSVVFSAILSLPAVVNAATVATVHTFQGGTDGGSPAGNISIGPDGSIYGKGFEGGTITVYRIDPATGLNTPLFSGFPGAADDANSGVAFGTSGLIYGASYFNAGSGDCAVGCGLIFQVNAATHSLTTLYQFLNNGDGRGSQGVVTGPGGYLYGVTDEGGPTRQGTLFRMNPATGKMTVLHAFNSTTEGTNGGIGFGIQFGPDGALYGTNGSGGQYGYGSIYRFDPLTRVLKVLHHFTPAEGNTYIFNTPPDLVISDSGGTIYGTTLTGGQYGKGMIFRFVVETNELTTMYSFNGTDGNSPTRLVAAPGTGGELYGLTVYGGTGNFGTLFKFNPANRKLTSLYSFTNIADGAYPGSGGLIFGADGTLYGTSLAGGSGHGTLFKLVP